MANNLGSLDFDFYLKMAYSSFPDDLQSANDVDEVIPWKQLVWLWREFESPLYDKTTKSLNDLNLGLQGKKKKKKEKGGQRATNKENNKLLV